MDYTMRTDGRTRRLIGCAGFARSHGRRLEVEALEEKRMLFAFGLFSFFGSALPSPSPPTELIAPTEDEPQDQGVTVEAAAVKEDPPVVEEPCSIAGVDCIHAGDEHVFRQIMSTPSSGEPKTFHIYPDAELDGLDIIGRHGDQIYFMDGAQIAGRQQSRGFYEADRGVVNIVSSSDLLITGLNATNNFLYQTTNSSEDTQSSTALNISESRNIQLSDTTLVGNGKTTLWVQGNSSVDLNDTKVDCYYFCIGVVASELNSVDLIANQFNPVVTADQHSTIWVSSSMRAPDGEFFGTSNVVLENTTVNKRTGAGMIAGNGRYDHRSNVRITGTTRINTSSFARARPDGWLPVHPNYFGINLRLEGDYPPTTDDVAERAGEFGRFVTHDFEGGGQPPEEAPLVVCDGERCLSTNDLFLDELEPLPAEPRPMDEGQTELELALLDQRPAMEEPVIEESVIEESVIEESVIEESVIEESVIEEPVIEEPVIEEPVEQAPEARPPLTFLELYFNLLRR